MLFKFYVFYLIFIFYIEYDSTAISIGVSFTHTEHNNQYDGAAHEKGCNHYNNGNCCFWRGIDY